MNTFLAATLIALGVALIGLIYIVVAGGDFVATLQASDAEFASMSNSQLYGLLLAGIAFAPFLFGVGAAVLYSWLGKPWLFLGITVGFAILFSIAAIASRTPLPSFKITANFVVALAFGLLLPLLTR